METVVYLIVLCFFFNDTATTEIYTLSLHDALPISAGRRRSNSPWIRSGARRRASPPAAPGTAARRDRKSTRLNSSHSQNSYAVFCLKKKKKLTMTPYLRKKNKQSLSN